MIPALAKVYLPALVASINAVWPDMPDRPLIAAQIEQETCISLRHSKCWNPRAELKTSREYGFGLGQITITSRFNNFEAAKTWHPSLKDWQWDDRFDAQMQLRAVVAYDRRIYGQVKPLASTEANRLAFMFSAYNGGYGGLVKDRALCRNSAGCDPTRWLGHVALYSWRSRRAVKGYGKSFFEINREYVHNIMVVRSPKYRDLL